MYLFALYRITFECFVLILCVCARFKGDTGGLVRWEGAQLDSDHRWNGFCTPWCHAWGTWEPTCLCLCPCECVFLSPPPCVLVFWVRMRMREIVTSVYLGIVYFCAQFIFTFTCMLLGWCFLMKNSSCDMCIFNYFLIALLVFLEVA